MASLGVTAKIGTAEQFREIFSPDQVNTVDPYGDTLLGMALSNTEPEERYAIANLLLDCGAQADFYSGQGEPALRILLTRQHHDATATTQLVQRLIDAGADVNARSRRGDGLLDALLILPHGDEDWIPIYDIVFSHGITGFETPNRAGFPPLVRARDRQDLKPELLRRIEEAVEYEAK
ncbi:hypothetical protein GCM10022198_24190 [Klugiella xanthotipulae]|uniref:hypothetical protein n=1 Tax=Klugiella xanthotipulae TaxID=244735 RepID=UPI001150F8A5|nr:hypothetical protein [Klugiella xanthotipulae]